MPLREREGPTSSVQRRGKSIVKNSKGQGIDAARIGYTRMTQRRSRGFTRRLRVARRGVLRTVVNHEPSVHYDWATLKPTPAASSFICHALYKVETM